MVENQISKETATKLLASGLEAANENYEFEDRPLRPYFGWLCAASFVIGILLFAAT
jgi:hypothetical protein